MPHAIPAILEPSGQVRLLEPIQVAVATRVIVTILEPPEYPTGDAQALLRLLREHRLPSEARLSAEDIDAQIEAERNAWD
jgi:hypothetical protein